MERENERREKLRLLQVADEAEEEAKLISEINRGGGGSLTLISPD